jgi:hypothetical protein
MTDQALKNLVASLAVAQAEMSKAQAKSRVELDVLLAASADSLAKAQASTQRDIAALTQSIKDTRGEVAGIGNSQGLVAEEFFYNSLLDTPIIGGVKYDQVHLNLNAGKRSDLFECDIALINGKSAALLEVKYKVKIEAVVQLENHIRRFKQFFPVFSKHTLYGGIAGFHIPSEVSKLAHEKGFFVLKRRGDTFTVDAKRMQGF